MAHEYVASRATPRITVEEEKRLARRAKRGCKRSLEKLITSNILLVISLARKYEHLMDMDELVGAGLHGLTIAARKYNPNRGKFSVLACFFIKDSMRETISNIGHPVGYPETFAQQAIRLLKMKRSAEESGEAFDLYGAADSIGVTHSSAVRMDAGFFHGVSLNDDSQESKGVRTIAERFADEQAECPYRNAESSDMAERLRSFLDVLNKQERLVVERHFGIDREEPVSMQVIGDDLGITRSRVQQVKENALEKMRHAMAGMV